MPNRLAEEASLYLRQHGENPVDWRPWNEAALAEARAQDKPILLSIGYSACHWCHVMAHESFEDAATGELMNRLFVSIKVDREERPDLDRIYQLAHQALTRRGGGWPLTVFLDPHTLLPFFAGTYFPKNPRYGMPAFAEVLQGARKWWDEKRDQVREQNTALQGFLSDLGRERRHEGELDDAPLLAARARLVADFDEENGGHRGAPKFPHAGAIELAMADARSGDEITARVATTTLLAMADRGLHDHLAGGFFRYCVDERWAIPHFEKMLYDNALLLLPVYAEAAAQFDRPRYLEAAEGIVDWLQTEMRAKGGGFCSALDADSEGVEGKYYLWTRADFDAALDPELRAGALAHFGVDRAPNFENHAWHLHADRAADGRVRSQLLAFRSHRVRPARDDKCLTAWNALLAHGLAQGGLALHREDWIDEAAAVFATITQDMDARGRLPAVLGRATPNPGFLDDHAFALQAALSLLRARWSTPVLTIAMRLADCLLRDFTDDQNGGFNFTADDHEPLPQRPKPWQDESTPSGNGVATHALLELGFLLAEPRYLDAAEATLRAGWSATNAVPQASAAMLEALREFLAPTPVVVVRGDAAALAAWIETLRAAGKAPLHGYFIPGSNNGLPPALAEKRFSASGRATLCRGLSCFAESDQPDFILAALSG